MRISSAAVPASLLSSLAPALGAGLGVFSGTPNRELTSEMFQISVLGGQAFRANQVANPAFMTTARGPRAMAKAYAKFGVALPSDLLLVLEDLLELLGLLSGSRGGIGSGNGNGSGRNNTGSGRNTTAGSNQGEVSAVPQMFDTEYLAAVSIGTPPQTLMLNFDTGSSDLWVFSSETPRSQQSGQTLYRMAASSTASKLSGATWSITYGDGSGSSGDVYLDTVSVGGVTVTGQAVESATQVSASFGNDTASSGLLGLAMNTINQVKPTPQKTFFSNAMSQLAMPLFTANLKKNAAGNYNFGFIDSTEFNGSISFVDVNTTAGFWQFASAGFAVGDGAMTAMPHQAIADTGTTLLLMPQAIVDAYYRQVTGARNDAQLGGYVFNCNAVLPDLTLAIGSYRAVVPGELINFAPADGLSSSSATTCFGGLQAGTGLPFAIYGDVFLKSQFTVFHGGNNQLGFASKGF